MLAPERPRSLQNDPGDLDLHYDEHEGLLISGLNPSALLVSFVCLAGLPFFFAHCRCCFPARLSCPTFRPLHPFSLSLSDGPGRRRGK